MLLKDKKVLITGSNGGIGRALIQVFAENGANIYAHGIAYDEEFEEWIKDIEISCKQKIVPIYFDFLNDEEFRVAMKQLRKEPIDILVNNAGVVLNPPKSLLMTSFNTHSTVMDVNFFKTIELTQLIVRSMLSHKKEGKIVNISSIAGMDVPALGTVDYVGSKSALIALTKKMAEEFATYNIRVNAIAPGLVDTAMINATNKEFIDSMVARNLLHRLGAPIEVAKVACFLASDLSSYITGQVLRIDGGMFA